jgi:transcriptional regulator with XRE-family HTH domain
MRKQLPPILSNLGPRIRDLRRARGLTQERIAEQTGIKAESISRIETGAAVPDLRTLVALADALGVPAGEVLALPATEADDELTVLVGMWSDLSPNDKRLLLRLAERLAQRAGTTPREQ